MLICNSFRAYRARDGIKFATSHIRARKFWHPGLRFDAAMLRDDLERGMAHAVKAKKLMLVEASAMAPAPKGGKPKTRS